MIPKDEIDETLGIYDKENITVGTLCSHSALNIFYGAKQEGFKTLGICQKERVPYYSSFSAAKPDIFPPDIPAIEDPRDMLEPKFQEILREHNTIVIPTGSFVAYVGPRNLEEEFLVPVQGNRKVLEWEGNRKKQIQWLKTSGVKIPKEFEEPEDIARLSITKFYGAKGGQGFFLAESEKDFKKEIKDRNIDTEKTKLVIQEYVLGVRIYPHMHFSPFSEKGLKINDGWLEILGYDQRMESNIDELHRTGLTRDQMKRLDIEESFTVVGNRPVIPREKLQIPYLRIGKKIVEASQKLFPPGMLGAFCPETICTKDMDIYTFEMSARIVAGTNMWAPMGAPEGWYTWGEPMSMGRRIGREIKLGIEKDRLEEVVY
ncbi:MAG: formate--phosphoribosylaminoimidazolecarboxamide ligase [Candidatus Bathyarchaeota archaeon]|jgi:5-formaminoimidazole-4-carboxamide-1-(beta)-D-ribofuranosyl 5'-monophosphate synthetase